MRSWDKYLAIAASVIYFVCLVDFVARSDKDITKKSISCGTLSKVEFSTPSGYRGSRLATMIYLRMNDGQKKYRIERKVNEARKSLAPYIGDKVCVASLSSPLLSFLVYPIEVVHESQGVVFKEPLERTYLNNEPYIFWLFMLPVSFALTKTLNDWAARKRKNA